MTATTPIRLTKHHGLGNDFLVYDLAQGEPSAAYTGAAGAPWPKLAQAWCDRRRGVGADGLLLLSIDDADPNRLAMVLYNADGSRAEMSGNGIRCLAQAAYLTQGHSGAAEYAVATDAGERIVTVAAGSPADPNEQWISVTMGELADLPEPTGWERLGAHPDRPVLHLDIGNPHSVLAVESVAEVPLEELGSLVAHVNLEVVEPGPEANAITMRVHERGAGITEACGTGACASAWAARQWGLAVADAAGEIVVHMPGGDATVRLHGDGHRQAVLSGATVFVASVSLSG